MCIRSVERPWRDRRVAGPPTGMIPQKNAAGDVPAEVQMSRDGRNTRLRAGAGSTLLTGEKRDRASWLTAVRAGCKTLFDPLMLVGRMSRAIEGLESNG